MLCCADCRLRGHIYTTLMRLDSSSIATLKRLSFRLIVVLVFAALWPGSSVTMVTGAFCILLAGACLIAANALSEPFGGPNLNRWDEAIFLFGVGLLVILVL